MITEDHRKELDEIFKACLENDDLLTDWENDFVSDYVDKLEQYGEKLSISSKQQDVIDRLENKLKKHGVV